MTRLMCQKGIMGLTAWCSLRRRMIGSCWISASWTCPSLIRRFGWEDAFTPVELKVRSSWQIYKVLFCICTADLSIRFSHQILLLDKLSLGATWIRILWQCLKAQNLVGSNDFTIWWINLEGKCRLTFYRSSSVNCNWHWLTWVDDIAGNEI